MLETDEAASARPVEHGRKGRALHLTITSIGGSVEHYHHFLLGFLVPLINQRARTWQNPNVSRVFIRSCGPMDALLRELKSEKIAILDKVEHQRLGESRPKIASMLRGIPVGMGSTRYMDLMGYDLPARYSRTAFVRARSALTALLEEQISGFSTPWPTMRSGVPRILLIARGKPNPFYLSEQSELKHAGATRRSIPNHAALEEALTREFGNVVNMFLEGMPLGHQIALFSAADIIIAQHGAALSNAIWARPSAAAIEIAPDTLDARTFALGFFSNLARCMGLDYRAIRQPGDHAEVDPNTLCRAVREVCASRVRPARTA